jgi:hypothetical protein
MKCIHGLCEIVVECNVKIVCICLLHVNNHLNLTREPTKPMTIEEKDYFFGQVILLDDVIISISKNELHYFDGYLCDQQITITL